MDVLICIDDTDNLETRGTGHLAEELGLGIERKGWGTCTYITRHQLFVHPDIPYTSHNSAMCFQAKLVNERYLDDVIRYAQDFLERTSAPGSDPGMCVAVPERLKAPAGLIAYGRRAKLEILTKDHAWEMAALQGMHLSEHGGTGGGVIGCVAGIGLRLSGSDGRIKGKLVFDAPTGEISVAEILAHSHVEQVRTASGEQLAGHELIRLGQKVKAVYLDGCSVLLAAPADPSVQGAARWRSFSRPELDNY